MSARERILDTAQALFAAQGFDATTTKEIAEKAGVATGLVFYYFKSKQEILDKLIQERTIAGELQTILETALKDDPYTTLVTIGVRQLRALQERRELVKILLQAWLSAAEGSALRSHLQELLRRNQKLLAQYLEQAIDEAKLAPVNSEVLAENFIGSMVFHALFMEAEAPEAYVQETVNILLGSGRYRRQTPDG